MQQKQQIFLIYQSQNLPPKLNLCFTYLTYFPNLIFYTILPSECQQDMFPKSNVFTPPPNGHIFTRDDHILQMSFRGNICHLVFLTLGDEQNFKKYFLAHDLEFNNINNIFAQFGDPHQFYAFMSQPSNYTMNFETGALLLKWRIHGHEFKRRIQFQLLFARQQLNQTQRLQCQVVTLRRKLANYEKAQQKRIRRNQRRRKYVREPLQQNNVHDAGRNTEKNQIRSQFREQIQPRRKRKYIRAKEITYRDKTRLIRKQQVKKQYMDRKQRQIQKQQHKELEEVASKQKLLQKYLIKQKQKNKQKQRKMQIKYYQQKQKQRQKQIERKKQQQQRQKNWNVPENKRLKVEPQKIQEQSSQSSQMQQNYLQKNKIQYSDNYGDSQQESESYSDYNSDSRDRFQDVSLYNSDDIVENNITNSKKSKQSNKNTIRNQISQQTIIINKQFQDQPNKISNNVIQMQGHQNEHSQYMLVDRLDNGVALGKNNCGGGSYIQQEENQVPYRNGIHPHEQNNHQHSQKIDQARQSQHQHQEPHNSPYGQAVAQTHQVFQNFPQQKSIKNSPNYNKNHFQQQKQNKIEQRQVYNGPQSLRLPDSPNYSPILPVNSNQQQQLKQQSQQKKNQENYILPVQLRQPQEQLKQQHKKLQIQVQPQIKKQIDHRHQNKSEDKPEQQIKQSPRMAGSPKHQPQKHSTNPSSKSHHRHSHKKNGQKQSKTQQRKKKKRQKSKSGRFMQRDFQKIDLGEGRYRINFSNGDYYVGQVQGVLFHGTGKYYSVANGTYDGQWKNGMAHGRGISIDVDGNMYVGNFQEDIRHGYGEDFYSNTQVYKGFFVKGFKSGKGTYLYKNGDFYNGQWANDMCHGHGIEYSTNGTSYQGEWRQDVREGPGIFHSLTGDFKQVYKQGKLQHQQQMKVGQTNKKN